MFFSDSTNDTRQKQYFSGRNPAFSSHSYTEVAQVRVEERRIFVAATIEDDAFPSKRRPLIATGTGASANGDSAERTVHKVRCNLGQGI